MPIVASRRREIEQLLAGLASGDARRRDAAVARLTLAGSRAVSPLLAHLDSAPPAALLAALTVLERLRLPAAALPRLRTLARHGDASIRERAIHLLAALRDARVVKILSEALVDASASVRLAAVAALSALHDGGAVEAIGPLVEAVLDEAQAEETRLASLEVLARLPRRELPEIARRLEATTNAAVARRLAALGLARAPERSLVTSIERLESARPADERALARQLAAAGATAAEALIRRLERPSLETPAAERLGRGLAALGGHALDAIHAALRRKTTPLALQILADAAARSSHPSSIPRLDAALRAIPGARAARGAAWAQAAAHVHLALASLGSRIALYDLRERLALGPPLAAPGLLQAAERIGDASLVPAVAALATEQPETRALCARTLEAIVRREHLRRSARFLADVRAEHRDTLAALWPRGLRPATRRRA